LGGIERSQFNRIQSLLGLPDPVWELADRYRLEEKRLRPVLKVDDESLQVQLVRLMVEQNLPADRIQQMVESGDLESLLDEADSVTHPQIEATVTEKVVQKWSTLAKQFSKADLTLVADQWVKRSKPDDLRRQVAALRRLLDLVERELND
jgi:hypothetical protein